MPGLNVEGHLSHLRERIVELMETCPPDEKAKKYLEDKSKLIDQIEKSNSSAQLDELANLAKDFKADLLEFGRACCKSFKINEAALTDRSQIDAILKYEAEEYQLKDINTVSAIHNAIYTCNELIKFAEAKQPAEEQELKIGMSKSSGG